MGNFFDDLYREVLPIVGGAVVGYFGGPQAGQATERSVDRLINGRPKPAPTVINQHFESLGHTLGAGVQSSEHGLTIIAPGSSPGILPGTGGASPIPINRGLHDVTQAGQPWILFIAVGGAMVFLLAKGR